jgi:hypothetical protein
MQPRKVEYGGGENLYGEGPGINRILPDSSLGPANVGEATTPAFELSLRSQELGSS